MKYDEDIDTNLIPLLDVLNVLPGIRTVMSCGGHENPEGGQLPSGKWYIEMDVKERNGVPTIGGYQSIRRIAGMCRYMTGVFVTVDAMAFPVYDKEMNADMVKAVGLYYTLRGDGADPDDVAEALSTGVIPKSLQRKDVRTTPKFWPME
jgi:hypothetical protein